MRNLCTWLGENVKHFCLANGPPVGNCWIFGMKYLCSNFSVVWRYLATQMRLCMFLSLSPSEDDTAKQIILKEVLVSATRQSDFLQANPPVCFS